eukprot:6198582-Pleurochrysis_carterae.AAC.2
MANTSYFYSLALEHYRQLSIRLSLVDSDRSSISLRDHVKSFQFSLIRIVTYVYESLRVR